MAKKIVIWGCGGFAREVHFLCEQLGLEVIGFLDERPEQKGKIINDVAVLGDIVDVAAKASDVVVVPAGVGDPALKQRLARKTATAGFEIAPTLVHPSVPMSRTNRIGVGGVITIGNALTVNLTIGDLVIINQLCSIGHDVVLDDLVTISPGANISGNVTIGEGTYVGTGASIREKVTIGSWSIIGGGAFVAADVPDRVLYAGVPAVLKKELATTRF